MDINKTLQELKARPGFAEHVGMTLVHNGVVRAWSRKDHSPVSQVRVTPDRDKMSAICREMEQRPGIFAILAAGVLWYFILRLGIFVQKGQIIFPAQML